MADRMTRQEALDLARYWAKRGIPVGPIAISWDEKKQATNKVPLTRNGHLSFTKDIGRLDALFGSPQMTLADGEVYGVGGHPGPADRVVLDVDTKGDKQGDKVLAELEAEHGALPPRPTTDTASGGTHQWLAKPPGVHVGNTDFAEDIEVRADDGWVVMPGTVTPWGSWTLRDGTEVPAPLWPGWVAARLNGHKSAGGTGRTTGRWQKLDRDNLDPRDLAALEALEKLGGHGAVLGPDGEVRVTRPGKTAGTSASVGYVDPGVVKVFTDDWAPLRKNDVYSVDKLVALANGEPVDKSQSSSEGHGRRLVLTSASSIKTRRVKWLWDTRVPLGTFALLAGRENLGKSTFAYWIAARITRGQLPGEHHGQPRAVLICATEDSWEHTVVPRLVAAEADLDLVYRVEVRNADDIHVGLSLPRDLSEVELAAIHADAVLLLLDPLMSRISAGLNVDRDAEVRRALEPMAALADRAGLTVLGIIHLNKTGSTDILDRVMSSKAFVAVARAVCAVAPDPDDPHGQRRLFGTPKNNLGRSDLPSIRFTIGTAQVHTDDGAVSEVGSVVLGDETGTTIGEAMERNSEDEDTRSQIADCKEWMTEYLAENSHADSRDVKKAGAAQGYSESTMKRARKALRVVVTNLSTVPRRTVWSLPPQSGQIPWGGTPTDLTGLNAGQSVLADQGDPTSGASRSSGDGHTREVTRLDAALAVEDVPICDCGHPLDQHPAPDCDTPVVHQPPDLWSTP